MGTTSGVILEQLTDESGSNDDADLEDELRRRFQEGLEEPVGGDLANDGPH